MSILSKSQKLSLIFLKPQNFICRTKYLFIFSHMRSRSSLLSHILGSNPDICGYSELHNSYSGYANLIKMRMDLTHDLKCTLNDKYLLDKLLHNNHSVSQKVFAITKPKVIFLLREPEDTIKSIINMSFVTGRDICYRDPKKALDYYCSRLESLEKYAKTLENNYLFIESDELVSNTDYVLEHLSKWLNLSKTLDKKYSNFQKTGNIGSGDPSNNIKSGIVTKTKGYSDIEIPLEILKAGKLSYNKCKNSLLKNQNLI
jgi:hypothetical protein